MKTVNVDDVLKILHKYSKYIFVTDEKRYSSMVDEIANLKALKQEPKTGHWIEHEHNGMSYIECPECSSWFLRMHLTRNSYCPNCGCAMIVPKESEG